MKVFISWSGERSRRLAEILSGWLPVVIQAVRPYFSPDDVSKGANWSTEIAKSLELCEVGLLCVTPENLTAPWLIFEAGALSKNLEKAKVVPILFEVEPTDLKGPLIQFQAAIFDREGMRRVIDTINGGLAEPLSEGTVEEVFQMWWPKLELDANAILQDEPARSKKSKRSDRDLLEEILALSRSQANLIRRSSSEDKWPARHLYRGIKDIIAISAREETVLVMEEPLLGLIELVKTLAVEEDLHLSDSLTRELRLAKLEATSQLHDDDIPF